MCKLVTSHSLDASIGYSAPRPCSLPLQCVKIVIRPQGRRVETLVCTPYLPRCVVRAALLRLPAPAHQPRRHPPLQTTPPAGPAAADAVPDPHRAAPHALGQQHVRQQAVADHGHLVRALDARLRVRAEVRHDLGPATGLRRRVPEHRDARLPRKPGGLRERGVDGRGAGGVGDDEEARAGVGGAEPVKVRLARASQHEDGS